MQDIAFQSVWNGRFLLWCDSCCTVSFDAQMGQRTLCTKKWEMKRNGLAEVEKEAFVKTNPSISIHKSLHAKRISPGPCVTSRIKGGLSYLYRAFWIFGIAQNIIFELESRYLIFSKSIYFFWIEYRLRWLHIQNGSFNQDFISKGLSCLRTICWSLDNAWFIKYLSH